MAHPHLLSTPAVDSQVLPWDRSHRDFHEHTLYEQRSFLHRFPPSLGFVPGWNHRYSVSLQV